jgi:hypothetical protein
MVRELRGHVGAVHAVVFNRDGNNIISGGLDGCMRIWDVPKQTCTLALNLRSGPLNAIAASRDGSILATSTESTTGEQKGASIQVNSRFLPPTPHDPHFFQIWSAHSFSRLASLPTKGPAKCVCVAGDSPYMVGAGDALGNVCVSWHCHFLFVTHSAQLLDVLRLHSPHSPCPKAAGRARAAPVCNLLHSVASFAATLDIGASINGAKSLESWCRQARSSQFGTRLLRNQSIPSINSRRFLIQEKSILFEF